MKEGVFRDGRKTWKLWKETSERWKDGGTWCECVKRKENMEGAIKSEVEEITADCEKVGTYEEGK